MTKLKRLSDFDGTPIFPITHYRACKDTRGGDLLEFSTRVEHDIDSGYISMDQVDDIFNNYGISTKLWYIQGWGKRYVLYLHRDTNTVYYPLTSNNTLIVHTNGDIKEVDNPPSSNQLIALISELGYQDIQRLTWRNGSSGIEILDPYTNEYINADDYTSVFPVLNIKGGGFVGINQLRRYNDDLNLLIPKGYRYNHSNRKLTLVNGQGTSLIEIDAEPFAKDGMVDTITISNKTLRVTFNRDADKDPIVVPITDYYTVQEVNTLLTSLSDRVKILEDLTVPTDAEIENVINEIDV